MKVDKEYCFTVKEDKYIKKFEKLIPLIKQQNKINNQDIEDTELQSYLSLIGCGLYDCNVIGYIKTEYVYLEVNNKWYKITFNYHIHQEKTSYGLSIHIADYVEDFFIEEVQQDIQPCEVHFIDYFFEDDKKELVENFIKKLGDSYISTTKKIGGCYGFYFDDNEIKNNE